MYLATIYNMMNKQEFTQEVNDSANVALQRANNFLKCLNLSVEINWEYDSWTANDLDDAIGVYESGSVFGRVISIGFHMNNLYICFKKQRKDNPFSDEYTLLDETIQTNVFHEVGHGIVELFEDYLQETDDLDELYDSNQELFDEVLDNEENSVEEFAWAMYDNELEESGLYEIIRLYLEWCKNQQNDLKNKDTFAESISRRVYERVYKVLREKSKETDDIPVDCGTFTKFSSSSPNYNSYRYFGNCVNTLNVFGDATTMCNFINNCTIINTKDIIYKIKDGDRRLPKELINGINNLLENENINNQSLIVSGVDTYQKILFVYLTKTDKHYFFDCA